MTKRKKVTHTHQYYKAYPYANGVFRGQSVWTCGLPDCDHFRPGNMSEPVGRQSLCNNCMGIFTLESEHMAVDKPICNRCAVPPEDRIEITDEDIERVEARIWLANKQGKLPDEISDAEIDKRISMLRLFGN